MYRYALNIGPIFLVTSAHMLLDLAKKRRDHPHLPQPDQIEVDLNMLNSEGGVPTLVARDRAGVPKLLVCTPFYCLELYETRKRNGYTISRVAPLTFALHDQLARTSLLLYAMYWHLCSKADQVPPEESTYWNIVEQAWYQLETPAHQSPPTTKPPAEAPPTVEAPLVGVPLTSSPEIRERYLQTATSLIEVTHRLSHDKHALFEAYTPGREGIIAAQQKALEKLREGKAPNPHLSSVIAEQSYQPYHSAPAPSEGSFNREQEEALGRALLVPDMLLIEGAPATGKTRTLAEIVRCCATEGQRVLVTTKTVGALDELLKLLPSELPIVRLNANDGASDGAQLGEIERRAREMQERILRNTEGRAEKFMYLLTARDTMDQWIAHLAGLIHVLKEGQMNLHDALQRRASIEQHINAPFAPKLHELTTSLQHLEETLNRYKSRLNAMLEWQNSIEEKSHSPGPAQLLTPLERLHANRIEAQQKIIQRMQEQYNSMQEEYQRVEGTRLQVLHEDPEYSWCEEMIKQIGDETERALQEGLKAAMVLQQTTLELVPVPPLLEQPVALETLEQYLHWYISMRPLLEQRQVVLQDWRAELATGAQQLHPELLRSVTVVAGTCDEIAAAGHLADSPFDLTIVDEAQQCLLPDLLPPLVRARRAILAGDQQQLPPLLGSKAQSWLEHLSPQEQEALLRTERDQIVAMLTKSVFEQLLARNADPLHVVRFAEQHRMPPVIAEFVSRHFYGGALRTASPLHAATPLAGDADQEAPAPITCKGCGYAEEFFVKQLIFVDTSDLPHARRKEAASGKRRWKGETSDPEGWDRLGYTNIAEAQLIVDLAAAYQSEGITWSALAPYEAQARLIGALLRRRLGAGEIHRDLLDRVPIYHLDLSLIHVKPYDKSDTIQQVPTDFSDVVLYSFTRSNTDGRVGLLKELRLLNVAMTRASKQVILVGDLSTLKQADDDGVRQLTLSLDAYVREHGELLSYEECRARLQAT